MKQSPGGKEERERERGGEREGEKEGEREREGREREGEKEGEREREVAPDSTARTRADAYKAARANTHTHTHGGSLAGSARCSQASTSFHLVVSPEVNGSTGSTGSGSSGGRGPDHVDQPGS